MLKKVSSVVSRQTKATPCSKLTLPGQKMSTRLALKSYKYALFYFPLDNTLETAKTSKLVSSMAKVKEGSMVEVNWDAANPCVPAKIIALTGKCYCFRSEIEQQQQLSATKFLIYNLRFLAQKDHTCCD